VIVQIPHGPGNIIYRQKLVGILILEQGILTLVVSQNATQPKARFRRRYLLLVIPLFHLFPQRHDQTIHDNHKILTSRLPDGPSHFDNVGMANAGQKLGFDAQVDGGIHALLLVVLPQQCQIIP
jgi:hypothetical protein